MLTRLSWKGLCGTSDVAVPCDFGVVPSLDGGQRSDPMLLDTVCDADSPVG